MFVSFHVINTRNMKLIHMQQSVSNPYHYVSCDTPFDISTHEYQNAIIIEFAFLELIFFVYFLYFLSVRDVTSSFLIQTILTTK